MRLMFCSVDQLVHGGTSFRARPSALASSVNEHVCRWRLGHSSPGRFLWQFEDAPELGGRLLFHGLLDLLAGLRMERRKGRRPQPGKWNLQLGDRTSSTMRASEGMTGRRHSMAVGPPRQKPPEQCAPGNSDALQVPEVSERTRRRLCN